MAATPKTGAATFVGLATGTTYVRTFYNTDVNGAYAQWDKGLGTPSASVAGADWVQFDEDVRLIDVSVVTGIVDTSQIKLTKNYKPTQYALYWPNQVNTLTTRTPLALNFKQGTMIGFQESI